MSALILIPYKPAHLSRLSLQPRQMFMGSFIRQDGYADMLAKVGPAYTGIADFQVVMCAGVHLELPGRGTAWCLLSEHARNHLLGCTRAVEEFLSHCGVRRVQTYVETAFVQGHRWAGMLGFAREGTLRAWGPNGEDYDLYARVTP